MHEELHKPIRMKWVIKSFWVVLALLCALLLLAEAYAWWRHGTVVLDRTFNYYAIKVREIPNVRDTTWEGILNSPPGATESQFVIEVWEAGRLSMTYRYFAPPSSFDRPIDIVEQTPGDHDEHYFKAVFESGREISVHITPGQSKWLETTKEDPSP